MEWGSGIGATHVMKVAKLHELLGELVAMGAGDLYVHGLANRQTLMVCDHDNVAGSTMDGGATVCGMIDFGAEGIKMTEYWFRYFTGVIDGEREA